LIADFILTILFILSRYLAHQEHDRIYRMNMMDVKSTKRIEQ